MKLSARNVLKGKVVEVIEGVTTHNVKIDIGHGIVLTSSITAEAVKDLKLKKGDDAYAIIKSSEVIVGKDEV
jgi:molybdopterin-binding protein